MAYHEVFRLKKPIIVANIRIRTGKFFREYDVFNSILVAIHSCRDWNYDNHIISTGFEYNNILIIIT